MGLTKKERVELRREHTAELYSSMWDIAAATIDGDVEAAASGKRIIIGLDEVGRGAIAGPLTVAAVALKPTPQIIGIDDSKKLTPKRREEVAAQILLNARAYGIAHIQPDEIDACGMAASLRMAMKRALRNCLQDLADREGQPEQSAEGADAKQAALPQPDAVLIDGNPMHVHPKETCIVKGDGKVACIAAASVLAKVTRDQLMRDMAEQYPHYAFDSNKGYGSAAHMKAVREFGPSDVHRRSFLGKILNEQESLL